MRSRTLCRYRISHRDAAPATGTAFDRSDAGNGGRRGLAGDGRYRLDFLHDRRAYGPRAVACDGARRWQEYDDRVIVGPVLPLEQGGTHGQGIVEMIDTAVLLACHLSNVAETEVAGRRGFAVRAAALEPPFEEAPWPPGSDVVVDAELGIALRWIVYAGDRQLMRYELRDVAPLSADGGEFTMDVPAGHSRRAQRRRPARRAGPAARDAVRDTVSRVRGQGRRIGRTSGARLHRLAARPLTTRGP